VHPTPEQLTMRTPRRPRVPSPASLEIRLATPAEYAQVADVCAAAYAELIPPGSAYETVLRDVGRRAEHAQVLVAAGERVLGTVTFVPAGGPMGEIAGREETEFRMLAVDPAAQGRGVAASLVGEVIDRTRALGRSAIVCSSLPEMRAAHRVYERAGFRRAPERDWSPTPGVALLAFTLALVLGASERQPK
jgi:ribosomal protein S18 acetylase RimI-like enzyme